MGFLVQHYRFVKVVVCLEGAVFQFQHFSPPTMVCELRSQIALLGRCFAYHISWENVFGYVNFCDVKDYPFLYAVVLLIGISFYETVLHLMKNNCIVI